MGKGEGRDQEEPGGEDLFEDLDKFFAPIQDVDWPETEEPPAAAPAGPGPPAGPRREEEPVLPVQGDTASFEAIPGPRGEAEDEGAEEDVPRPTPGQEDLFAEPSAADEPVPVWSSPTEAGEEPAEDDGVSSFLFETEDETGDQLSEGASSQAPDDYVDLPSPEDEDAVAELEEDVAADEPAPDLDAVEAAADRFAESVREEVRVEPVDAAATEEAEIAALLGDEEVAPEAFEAEPPRTVRVGPEGLGGPSWQEPTALEVGAEPERRGAAGRDVPMAFLTGLVLAGLALGAIAIGPGPFAVLAGAIVLFAQGEFYLALQKRHYQPATALGLVSGALVLGAGYYRGEGAMLAVVALSIFAAFLWYMTVPIQHRRNVVTNVALTVLGVVYIPMLAGYALAVLRLPDGRGLALAIIGLTIAYDISAFAVGYLWGSRPLAPNVSPKKSWEGAIGATLVVVGVAVGAVTPLVDILDTIGRAVGLAVVVAIFAPLGDLAESVLKRDLGVKDIGSVLPGHGGVLDRIDSVLFVAPAAFIFLRLILL